jgi:hypothetical protein
MISATSPTSSRPGAVRRIRRAPAARAAHRDAGAAADHALAGATVTEAMRAMQREHRGCVLVTDDGTAAAS